MPILWLLWAQACPPIANICVSCPFTGTIIDIIAQFWIILCSDYAKNCSCSANKDSLPSIDLAYRLCFSEQACHTYFKTSVAWRRLAGIIKLRKEKFTETKPTQVRICESFALLGAAKTAFLTLGEEKILLKNFILLNETFFELYFSFSHLQELMQI